MTSRHSLTLVLLVVALASGTRASAQSSADVALLPLLLPPAAVAVAFDIAAVAMMAQDGSARRGWAITGIVFSGVLTGLSALTLVAGATSNFDQFWNTVSAGGLSLGLGSLALEVVALVNTPLSPDPAERAPSGPRAVTPVPPPLLQDLRLLPTPMFGPRGNVGFGGAMSFRW